MYLDANGKIKELSTVQRRADHWKGFVLGLKNKQIDHFSDHLIDRYVEYIYQEATNGNNK